MSIILSTRRGFLYQDKFVLLLFFKHLLRRDIQELFADLPFGPSNRRSMDVKLILKTSSVPDEKVYSVKTGESFKNGARVRDTNQIRESFKELQVYDSLHGIDTELEMNLIILPPILGRISACWTNLKWIEGKSRCVGDALTGTEWLFNYLSMPEFPTIDDLFNFSRKLKIDNSFPDTPNSPAERETPIEQVIIREIETVTAQLGTGLTGHQLPPELLMYRMLNTCQMNSGTGQNIAPLLNEDIIWFVAQRKIINPDGTGRLEDKLPEARSAFEIWMNTPPQSALIVPTPVSNNTVQTMEGGTIHA